LGPKGTLYRLFSGRYATPDEAFQFRGKHHLNGARALKAPWTVMIKQNTNLKELETIQAQIEQQKIDTYIMASPEGRYYLLSGAYVSKHGAQEMVHEIHQKTNITSFVVKI
jgi:hypothetical protein